MSDFLTDLGGIYATGLTSLANTVATHNTNSRQGQDLEMQDFLNLMVATFQNQTIDNTADISDMMNNMVQMSVIQTMTSLQSLITEATNMSYAASLVGKDVTIGVRQGTAVDRVSGTVTGTGMQDGRQVVFLGEESYWMSDILSVGQLPDDYRAEQIARAEAARAAEEARAAAEAKAPDTGRVVRSAVQSRNTSGLFGFGARRRPENRR